MFDLFKKGLSPKPEKADDDGPSTHFNSTRHEGLNTLELAQLVLSDTVRRNGIPSDWLRVECLDLVAKPNLAKTHLQLVMQRWSDQLLHYSAALQQQFLVGLDDFEPGVDHSGFVVSWRFASDCVMPSALIPEGISWHVAAHR
jgi:hypothetical protein